MVLLSIAGTILSLVPNPPTTILLLVLFFLVKIIRGLIPRNIPGVPAVPNSGPFGIFGCVKVLRDNFERLPDWRNDMWKQYGGAFSLSIPYLNCVAIFEPEDVKYILKDHFDHFEKGKMMHDSFVKLLGEGIFNVDGKMWSDQRKIASHMFAMKVMRDDMANVFAEEGYTFLKNLQDLGSKGGGPIDIQKMFFSLTMDATFRISFGVNTAEVNATSDGIDIEGAFDELQGLLAFRKVRNPFHQYTPWTWEERRIRALSSQLDQVAFSIIAERRKKAVSSLRSYPDLLSRFISWGKENDTELSDKYLRDIIMNFLVAGRDTTAVLMTWMVVELDKNPEVVDQMLDEIKQVCPTGVPTYSDLKNLPYLEAVILETLRLHPSVPIDIKITCKADVLPCGARVRPGDCIHYIPYSMGRNEKYWPNPEKFDPHRFYDNVEKKVKTPDQYVYPVFNAGPRTCLGRRVAIMEAKQIISMLYSRFHVKVVDPEAVHYEAKVVLRVKGALPVTLTPRS